jgi:hypothetical protein
MIPSTASPRYAVQETSSCIKIFHNFTEKHIVKPDVAVEGLVLTPFFSPSVKHAARTNYCSNQ